MHLLYFADPLCSWCYGFGPELAKLLARDPAMRVDLVMGGLRPFTQETMSSAFKDMLRTHWAHVAQSSGLPFNAAVLDREGFVYDTEPPCRAVVTARNLDASKALALIKAVQAGFYRDARDVTRPEVLADIAGENGYDRQAFGALLETPAMRDETKGDFASARSLGVSGFPTLAATYGSQIYLVTSGFATDEVLYSRLQEIDRLAATKQ